MSGLLTADLGASALGGLASGIGGMFGASGAAKAEENMLNQYLTYAKQQQATNAANLQPYMNVGQAGASAFQNALPSLEQSFNPTVAQLQATPGYQFEQQQGQMGTNNAMAAEGLSGSGAELGALNQYNTGLANQTYQSLADIYNQNRATTLGVLQGATGTGESAAQSLGQIGASLTGNIGEALTGMGHAQAGGIAGSTNALTGIFNNLGQTAMTGAVLNKMFGGGSSSGSGGNAAAVPNDSAVNNAIQSYFPY